MSKQVLTVEQTQHLQELGLPLKETTFCWIKPEKATDDAYVLSIGNVQYADSSAIWDYIPAYTLQDMLDVLPKEIVVTVFNVSRKYHLELGYSINHWYITYTNYDDLEDVLYDTYEQEPIDAAYEILYWLVKNGEIEINKAEEKI